MMNIYYSNTSIVFHNLQEDNIECYVFEKLFNLTTIWGDFVRLFFSPQTAIGIRVLECHRSWCGDEDGDPTASVQWPDHWPGSGQGCWEWRRSSQWMMWFPSEADDGADDGGVAVEAQVDDGGNQLGLAWKSVMTWCGVGVGGMAMTDWTTGTKAMPGLTCVREAWSAVAAVAVGVAGTFAVAGAYGTFVVVVAVAAGDGAVADDAEIAVAVDVDQVIRSFGNGA